MSNYKDVDIKKVKDATYIGIWTSFNETPTPDIKVQLETYTRTDAQEHNFDNVPEIFYGEFYPKNNNDERFTTSSVTSDSPIPAYKFQDNFTQSVIIKVLLPENTEQICFYNGEPSEATQLCEILTFFEKEEASTINAPFSAGNALLRYTLTSHDHAKLEIDLHTNCDKSHQEDICFIANDLKNDNFVSYDLLIKNKHNESSAPFTYTSGNSSAWESRIINGNVISQDLQLYYCGNLMYAGEDVTGANSNYTNKIVKDPVDDGWQFVDHIYLQLRSPNFNFESLPANKTSTQIDIKLIVNGEVHQITKTIHRTIIDQTTWSLNGIISTWRVAGTNSYYLIFSYTDNKYFKNPLLDNYPYLTIHYKYNQ